MSNNNFFIHPSAIVETDNIGSGSKIWAFVHILPDVKIGDNANICDHSYIENNVVIGNNVTVKCGVWLWDGVVVKNNVLIGPSVAFTNDLYPRSKNTEYDKKVTLLEDGCSIGANSTLIAGIRVGEYAMIGAGSVVTKDVGDFELVYGNPAQPKGFMCKCGKKLEFSADSAQCECGCRFAKNNNQVSLL